VKCSYTHAQSKFSLLTYAKHKHTKPKLNKPTPQFTQTKHTVSWGNWPAVER